MWATNCISMVHISFSGSEAIYFQLMMLVPIVFSFACVRNIAKKCVVLTALSELDLQVVMSVLVEMEDMLVGTCMVFLLVS